MSNRFHIIAFASHGDGISGGDRIFIELTRNLQDKLNISIHTWEEGEELIKRQKLSASKKVKIISYNFPGLKKNGNFLINYLLRILLGIKVGLFLNIKNKSTIYTASEFWMDVFAASVLKIRYRKNIKLIATWYQTAPNPFKGYTESDSRENNFKLNALLYWISQQPSKLLINFFADKVVVNNESEKQRFSTFKLENIFVMIGAVPLEKIDNYLKRNTNSKKVYDAVFQGRFHAQKGITELIDIWKKVVNKNPNAKLALIGDGPLKLQVEKKISEYNLKSNVQMFGYVNDGKEKFEIFNKSKIVVHPAFYDSGGMASAEAMAFGLPCVGFDLKAYQSYYPKGMIKVPKSDLNEFSDAISTLLKDSKKRHEIGTQARNMIYKKYSWEKRSKEFLEFIYK